MFAKRSAANMGLFLLNHRFRQGRASGYHPLATVNPTEVEGIAFRSNQQNLTANLDCPRILSSLPNLRIFRSP
jgi:hypothetical protein